MKAKPVSHIPNLKTLLIGGAISVFVVGGLFTAWRERFTQVWAAPDEIRELKKDRDLLMEQTTNLGKYVDQQKIKSKAPPGYRWDESTQEFVLEKRGR